MQVCKKKNHTHRPFFENNKVPLVSKRFFFLPLFSLVCATVRALRDLLTLTKSVLSYPSIPKGEEAKKTVYFFALRYSRTVQYCKRLLCFLFWLGGNRLSVGENK
jgi:hypothetical protein